MLPGGEAVSENSKVPFYYRKDGAGRLMIGGRGSFTEVDRPGLYRLLRAAEKRLFPEIAGARFEYRWAGKVALTRDHLPHLHEPAPGLVIALGYNGRGIGAATVMGKRAARRAFGAPPAEIPFPVTPVRPIPLHGLYPPVLHMMVQYWRLREALGV